MRVVFGAFETSKGRPAKPGTDINKVMAGWGVILDLDEELAIPDFYTMPVSRFSAEDVNTEQVEELIEQEKHLRKLRQIEDFRPHLVGKTLTYFWQDTGSNLCGFDINEWSGWVEIKYENSSWITFDPGRIKVLSFDGEVLTTDKGEWKTGKMTIRSGYLPQF